MAKSNFSKDIKRLINLYNKSAQKDAVKRISNIPAGNKNRQLKNIQKQNRLIADTQTN